MYWRAIASMLLAILPSVFKSPQAKAQLRDTMLAILQGIKTGYAGDPDFQ